MLGKIHCGKANKPINRGTKTHQFSQVADTHWHHILTNFLEHELHSNPKNVRNRGMKDKSYIKPPSKVRIYFKTTDECTWICFRSHQIVLTVKYNRWLATSCTPLLNMNILIRNATEIHWLWFTLLVHFHSSSLIVYSQGLVSSYYSLTFLVIWHMPMKLLVL